MTQNDPNTSPLIYEMDSSSEDQNQDQSDISNSSKSNQNKKHQQQTQVSQIPADNFQTTQIIKIKPNSHQNTQNQQISLSLTSNPKVKNPSSLIFSQSSQDKEEKNQQQQDYDLQSPAKLRRSNRKRQVSPAKRRPKQNKQPIFDDTQISLNQQSITQMKSLKEVQKAPSYLQIEDSQRYFDINKQFKGLIQQNKHKTSHNKDTNQNQQIPFQRKRYQLEREYQQQQVQEINEFQEQNDQYQNDEGQNYYENDQGSQQEAIPKYKASQKQSAVKVLKNLPKQITVQTTVETLVMNAIPKGLKLSCTFVIDKKFMGLSTQYNLIINSTNRTVLSAKKEHFSFTSSKFIISLNQNYITKRNDNLGYVGRLVSNFSGNMYELTKRDISLCKNSQNSSTKNGQKQSTKNEQKNDQQKESQSLQAIINFQNNLWGYGGMRKMQILKLNKQKLTERDKIKKTNFQQVYERGQMSKLIKIQTCKPIYNKVTKRYSIDFGNKVKIPSAKNMIMEYTQAQKEKRFNKQKSQKQKMQKNTRQKSLLIAKEKDDRYFVQVGYPLSLYEAFAACLANNDSKLLVN